MDIFLQILPSEAGGPEGNHSDVQGSSMPSLEPCVSSETQVSCLLTLVNSSQYAGCLF